MCRFPTQQELCGVFERYFTAVASGRVGRSIETERENEWSLGDKGVLLVSDVRAKVR